MGITGNGMTTLRMFQVDSFTAVPFSGNPAGVCVTPEPLDEAQMRAIAAELNCSETAFLVPQGEDWQLRWFTPTTEVDLCGHATLASAHTLWEAGHLAPDATARFQTRSGELRCDRQDDGWIAMDFPAQPPRPLDQAAALSALLGLPVQAVATTPIGYWIAELADEAAVRACNPDQGRLAALDCTGLIITAPAATATVEVVSRFFAPRLGIAEDPVTGSAHCALAPYWQPRCGDRWLAYQASARGGHVRVECRGERVLLAGEAVTTLRIELTLP